MGFFFFLLVTAALLIRPSEQFADLRNINVYQALIIPCFLLSFSSVVDQFTIKSLEIRPISFCVFGLLFAVVLSHLSNGNGTYAAESGFEFSKVLVYYVLLVGNVTTMYRLRVYLFSLGLFAVAFVSLAVLQYHEVIPYPEPEYAIATTTDRPKGSEAIHGAFIKEMDYDPVIGQVIEIRRLRGTGTFKDPNDLCLLLTMGLFIAFYGLTDPRLGGLRWGWIMPVFLFLYALELTQSRGGLLSLLAGSIALFYARFGWRGTLWLGAPLVPVALVLFGGRMASMSASEGTGQTRVQIWSDAIATLIGSPLFGVGMNEIGATIGKAAHNSFLHAFAELGLFGGTLFFGAFFFAAIVVLRLVRHRDWVPEVEMRRLLPYLFAIVVAYIVGILSLSRIEAVPTYLILALVTATSSLVAIQAPVFTLRLDGRLMQRLVLGSAAFLFMAYLFVRVVKV
jgi:hypothetical protein